MSIHVMNRNASSLNSSFSDHDGIGQTSLPHTPFLQRVQEMFSEKMAIQIGRAY